MLRHDILRTTKNNEDSVYFLVLEGARNRRQEAQSQHFNVSVKSVITSASSIPITHGSTTTGTSSNEDADSSTAANPSSGLSTGATTGIAVGAILGGLLIFGGVGWLIWRELKGHREHVKGWNVMNEEIRDMLKQIGI